MANVTPPLRQRPGYTAKPVQPKPSQGSGQAGQQARSQAKPKTGGAKSSDSNLLAALGYVSTMVFSLIIPLIIYLFKKEDRFVRFHALQAILVQLVLFIVGLVVGLGGFVVSIVVAAVTFGMGMFLVVPVFMVITFALIVVEWVIALFLAYKAYQGEYYKLPLIGDFCEQHI